MMRSPGSFTKFVENLIGQTKSQNASVRIVSKLSSSLAQAVVCFTDIDDK